jgi:hypothetical protein
MFYCPIIRKRGRESFALIVTLGLVAICTILLVIFVTAMQMDRTASFSYSQSLKAHQLAYGGLHLVVAQLQDEMQKDAAPDTGGYGLGASVLTNVTAANVLPQGVGTNSAMPNLLKVSTNAPFFTSGANASSTLQACPISCTATSLNGRYISARRWNNSYFGTFPSDSSTPSWVMMTRAGPTNASSLIFGSGAAGTINNPSTSNTNYAVGRFAYAVYDEGSLLDVTVAGYPTNYITSPSQLQAIKGTLAGADLTQVGITNPQTFVEWRNAATAASSASYMSYVTNFAATNGFTQVANGDTTFLSRQDLIAAAQAGVAGLTTSCLTNLTTFTRELNAPSWSPETNAPAGGIYKYAANALLSTASPFSSAKPNPNRLAPQVHRTKGGTVTAYLANGQPYTYTVNAGDTVALRRFPLDRLNWITPSGPATGISAAAIQACFGLVWTQPSTSNPDSNWTSIGANCLWQYVGPSGSTEQGSIETLDQVAAEATPREPNFFELLQAGILSGSLGINALADNNKWGTPLPSMDQSYSTLQVLRIGASMISQVQSSAYPVNIEYLQNDANSGNVSLVACGVANLPYISGFQPLCGASPSPVDPGYNIFFANTDQPTGTHTLATYFLFQLWNPAQQSATATPTRPNVRLCLQGSVGAQSQFAAGQGYTFSTVVSGTYSDWGFTQNIPANSSYIQLASTGTVGVNGFLNPALITSSDVASGSSSTQWIATQTGASALYVDPKISYEAFHVMDSSGKDLKVNMNQTIPYSGTTPPAFLQDNMGVLLGFYSGSVLTAKPDTTQTFQLLMKYQDPSGNWIPYDYWIGDNDPLYWAYCAKLGNAAVEVNFAGQKTQQAFAVPVLSNTLNCTGGYQTGTLSTSDSGLHATTALSCDPRSIRFGPWLFSGSSGGGANALAAYTSRESLWAGDTKANLPSGTATFGTIGFGEQTNFVIPPAGSVPGTLGNSMGSSASAPFRIAYLPAWLSRNNTANVLTGSAATSYSSYTDTDGIQRIADSGLFTNAPSGNVAPPTGNPFYMAGTRTSDRPVILNRPFNSAGEIGYTFRDDPWRSLDFFSAYNGASTSADAGLLDYFTVTDATNTVVAGRINLNTQNTAVLQAVLNNTLADTVGNTGASTLSNPTAMAQKLAAYTAATPLVNKDQLVTGFGPTLPIGATAATPFGSTDEQSVKACREAYVRSLADVGQTRTWNLMIDVIAQAGHYPPTAKSLDQFVVEGEFRVWLHVAIDRFTGQVIDEKLEPVNQ